MIFFIALIACALAGCAGGYRGGRGDGDFAAKNAKAAPLKPIPSTINVPVEIKAAVIEKIINDTISGVFYRDEAELQLPGGGSGIKFSASARKNGLVKISVKGTELTYSVPVKVTLRISTTVSLLGKSHTEYQDVEAGIAFRLRTKIFLKNDWLISTTTTAAGYAWTNEPVLKIRSISIPIKPVADYVAAKLLEAIGPQLDKTLSKSDIVKKTIITPLWEQLYTPIGFAIPETQEQMWIRFNPDELYLSNLNGRGASISAVIGIRAVTEAIIGDKPETRTPMPLPNFKAPPLKDSTFTVNLYAEIPYDRATAICKEFFIGKTFKSGLQSVTVNDIEVAGINENGLAVLKMDLSGSLKGTVRVTGRAYYDDKANALLIDDLDYDLATASKYQKTKSWLLKGIIISKMKPHMKFPLAQMLDAEALAKSIFDDYPKMGGIALSGRIDSLSVRGVEMTENTFRAAVLAVGVAGVTVTQ